MKAAKYDWWPRTIDEYGAEELLEVARAVRGFQVAHDDIDRLSANGCPSSITEGLSLYAAMHSDRIGLMLTEIADWSKDVYEATQEEAREVVRTIVECVELEYGTNVADMLSKNTRKERLWWL